MTGGTMLVMKYRLLFVLLAFCFLVPGGSVWAAPIVPGSFSTSWNTNGDLFIDINLGACPSSVYWEEIGNSANNGTTTSCDGGTFDQTITFPSSGEYRVDFSGAFAQIDLGSSFFDPNRTKLFTVEQWGNSVWTDLSDAFSNAINLTIPAVDVPDLSNVTSLARMFRSATNFNDPINAWDVSNVTNMASVFRGASSFNQDLSSWDVSNVTNMSGMFADATSFNQDISAWDVSQVTIMGTFSEGACDGSEKGMFSNATAFNQPIGGWDVANVRYFCQMFSGATSFNQDISTWNVSSGENFRDMFFGATAFNQPLNSWDMISALNFEDMFENASSFNQDISLWNVSNVNNMRDLFSGATSFNQPLNSWDVSGVIHMDGMFSNATTFNQPLNSWNVTSVTDMGGMFLNATAFNQDISSWNVSNVSDMQNLFIGSALSSDNYTSILSSWSELLVQSSVYFDTDAQYCSSAQAARDILIGTYTWVIIDGGATTDCATEDSDNSSGSSGTRVGDRIKSYFYSSTTSSTPMTVTKESFIQSVRNFIEYLTKNEADLQKLTPEESAKVIVGLRDILMYLLTLLPGI